MSLRPNISGFSLAAMQSLFSCGNPRLLQPLLDEFEETDDDPESLARAEQLFSGILMGDLIASPPEEEDEVMQLVMVCLAYQGQVHVPSESLFWEAFMVRLPEVLPPIVGGPTDLLRSLEVGRPMLGKYINTNWMYYAYFTNTEARQVFSLIEANPGLQSEYGFQEAQGWMSRIREAGMDVWYFAS